MWLLLTACASDAAWTLALATEAADECGTVCVVATVTDGEGEPVGGVRVRTTVNGEPFTGAKRTDTRGEAVLCRRQPPAGSGPLTAIAGEIEATIPLDVRPFGELDGRRAAEGVDEAPAWTPTFTVEPDPLLTPGGEGAWDAVAVALPTVTATPEGYAMWYAGKAAGDYLIGTATSPDGRTWTRAAGNPLIREGAEGAWNQCAVNGPMLLPDDDGWRLYFDGRRGGHGDLAIGLATGPDPLELVEAPENPVFTWTASETDWAGNAVAHPSVQRDEDGNWHLWYSTGQQQIGYAWSPDGRSWARYCRNPVFTGGTDADWERAAVKSAEVIRVGEHWVMSYSGGGSGHFALGWATSRDGLHWQRAPAPVLEATGRGWQAVTVFGSAPLVVGDELWLWFTGADGTGSSIGLAKAPLPGSGG
jgi:hypothetical protein